MNRKSVSLWKFVAAERRDQRAGGPRCRALAALLFSMIAVLGLAMARPVCAAETVIVPYDATKPVAGQVPDQFYLPYERFLELWQAAKKNRAGTKAEAAAVPFALSAARYEGVVGERSVAFTGRLDVTTYNEAWVKVPLPFQDVQIGALKIDGAAAAFDGGAIIVEKPGRHTVEVTFEIPLARGATAFQWGVPRTGATLVALKLPEARMRAVVVPGSGVIERTVDGAKIVTAAVGTTDRVRVTLEMDEEIARVAESAVANFGPWVTVTPSLETVVAAYTFSFPKARQDRFTVYFENGLTLTGLQAPNVKSWKLTAGGARQALEVVLTEPAREEYSFSVTCERPTPKLPAELRAPVFSAAARRLESGVALFAGRGVEVAALPSPGLRQTPLVPPADTRGRLIAAFNGTGALNYRVALAEPQREARIDYAYQVNRRKIELIASLQLAAKGDDLYALALALPAQFDVQAVQSERLQDWWREGDTLHLRFAGATPQVTPLVIYLVRQYPTAPTELEVQPLKLDGFKRVSGEAVIAAHKGVEVKMKLSADATEIAPEKAATDFQILPPLERKRGFKFTEQKFAAQVALAALPAKTNALWVMHALAHEGWVGLSTHVQLTLRQGSIDRASFTLPAGVPEARVTGGEVRETRSKIEGDRRVYEVQFQNDVSAAVEFTVDLELPNPGEVALPSITFPEAQMTSGFVLTDNASEFEMKVKTSGTDPAPVSEIPFLPELSKAAGLWRVQPAWSVTVGVERLEKAASRAAFVAWAEMTTALRPDGTEWHRATYRLQNRSLQFLPVKMPAGAELMSVRVAGQSVRADAGKVNGQQAILVPLIKTKPGDLSYDVELVWRFRGPKPGWRATQDLREPELLGVTVERTLWNVWVPDDRKLAKSGGNMEVVLGDLNKTEKIEGKLQELKSLASILSSSRTSAETKAKAKANWGLLKSEIESENRDDNFAETNSYFRRSGATPKPTPVEEAVGKKGFAQQGDYVLNKRKALNDELGREVEKLVQIEKNVSAAQSPAGNRAVTANALDALNAAPQGGVNNAQVQQQSAAGGQANEGVVTWAAQPGQVWNANGSYAQAKPAATPPPANAVGNNLYLNDNIVLQQRIEKSSKAEDKKSGEGLDTRSKKMEAGERGDFDDFAKKLPVLKDAKNELEDMGKVSKSARDIQGKGEKTKEDTVFNTARGNSVRFAEQQQQLAQVPAPATAAKPVQPQEPEVRRRPVPLSTAPALPPAEAPVPATPAGRGGANRVTVVTGSQLGVVNGGFAGGVSAATAEAQRLQTAGRISLAVDFPTEGQVFHFKKVKANAQLALTTSTPETWVRWQWLALALMLAAALLGVRRLWERRVGQGPGACPTTTAR